MKLAAPLSFGTRWVAPILPEFFRRYPDIAVDLHLTDAQTDLIGDGFDAALRIAVLEDSSLVARLIAPVRRFVVASPTYIARYGRPQHPHDLVAHQCLSYTNRSKRDVWRFAHRKTGEESPITPTGPLRGTSAEALLPTVLEGLAITELPEFIATQYFPDGQLEPILTDWRLPGGDDQQRVQRGDLTKAARSVADNSAWAQLIPSAGLTTDKATGLSLSEIAKAKFDRDSSRTMAPRSSGPGRQAVFPTYEPGAGSVEAPEVGEAASSRTQSRRGARLGRERVGRLQRVRLGVLERRGPVDQSGLTGAESKGQ